MSDHKYKQETYAFYDRNGIIRYLEDQARQGWRLDQIGGVFGFWRYQRIDPAPLRFAVSYLPRATSCDPAPSEESQVLQDLCAHSGWTLAASSIEMQIFYTQDPDALPLETDPVVELESIRQVGRRRFVPSWAFLLALAVLMLGALCLAYREPVGWLVGGWGLLMLLYGLTELLGYFRWLPQSGPGSAAGDILTHAHVSPDAAGFNLLSWAALAALVVLVLKEHIPLMSVLPGILGCCIGWVVMAMREQWRKEGLPAEKTGTMMVLLAIALILVISFVMMWFE